MCILLDEGTLVKNIAEACFRWSSQIAVSEEAIFIEVNKSRLLFSEESLRERAIILCRRFGVKAKIAIANRAGESLALARFDQVDKNNLPIEALNDFLFPFQPDKSLDPMIDSLKQLGILSLKSFIDLPSHSLTGRFGKLGSLVTQKVKGEITDPWPSFNLPEKVIEVEEFENEWVQALEPLLFRLKTVVDRSLLRLRGRGEKALSINLKIYLEKFSVVKEPVRQWVFYFPVPQGHAASVLDILRERLNRDLQNFPFEAPIQKVEIQILESVMSGYTQRDFFSRREQEEISWEQFIGKVEARIGREHCFVASPVASYQPEKSWQKESSKNFFASLTTETSEQLELWPLPERPLRLLPKPIRLGEWKNLATEVIDVNGPERLSSRWWENDEMNRDYFRARLKNGEEWWIYRDLSKNISSQGTCYFLHGVFD